MTASNPNSEPKQTLACDLWVQTVLGEITLCFNIDDQQVDVNLSLANTKKLIENLQLALFETEEFLSRTTVKGVKE
jgi:hypothetical protein